MDIKKIFIIISSWIFLALPEGTLNAQQTSNTFTYGSVQGTNVIARPNSGMTCIVLCSHKNGNEAEFTLGTKVLKTTIGPYVGLTGNERDGFTVECMDVLGNTCYFCGKQWHETLEIIHLFDGSMQLVPTYQYKGFLGRFNIDDILDGSNNYEIMTFDETKELNKIVASGDGYKALGMSTNNTPIILELDSWPLGWRYRIGVSSRSDEVFSNIEAGGTKTIIASRFDGSSGQNMLERKIGLRYGNSMNFCSDCDTIYSYDVQDIFNFGGVGFSSVSPLQICRTYVGNEIVVAYIGQQYSWANRLFMFKVSTEGSGTVLYQFSDANHKYSKITEIKLPQPLDTPQKMVMLMESTNGESTLRFPFWSNALGVITDTILYDANLKIQSIHPGQVQLGMIYVSAGGYDPNNANKVMLIQQHEIHDVCHWDEMSCRSVKHGEFVKDIVSAPPDIIYSEIIKPGYQQKSFTQKTFQASITNRVIGC